MARTRLPDPNTNPINRSLFAAGGLSFAALLGAISYSKYLVPHDLPLPAAVSGERRAISGRAGMLNYYVAGQGAPLLLIHSINAAASAYELRPVFEYYRERQRVYAPDLPGFGFSERSKREYTVQLYVDAILDMLDEIEREQGVQPIDAMALSLGCEFLARAANKRPERFRTLAFVSPTGFSGSDRRSGEIDAVVGSPAVRDALNFPLWSRPFYDLLTIKPSLRFFLGKSFGSEDAVDPGLEEYAYLTTHQPGAQYAPYAFVSGTLFSADVDRIYTAVQQPVWMVYGERGDFSDYRNVDKVRNFGNWTLERMPTGALPYFEQPVEFAAAYDAFRAAQGK